MNIILFSKESFVLEHWKNMLEGINLSHYQEIIHCSSFKALGSAIADENHILLYHLLAGDENEKICYQFISKYQQQQKMIVFVNSPDATQGLRLFRSGVHGYSNTFLNKKKLLVSIDVIVQGKIWIGAEILSKLLNDCCLNSNQTATDNQASINPQSDNSSDGNILDSLFRGVKKLFG